VITNSVLCSGAVIFSQTHRRLSKRKSLSPAKRIKGVIGGSHEAGYQIIPIFEHDLCRMILRFSRITFGVTHFSFIKWEVLEAFAIKANFCLWRRGLWCTGATGLGDHINCRLED